MKKVLIFTIMALCMTVSASAITYEEVFDSIKSLPQMKGIDGTMISGDNDFVSLGITHAQMMLWDGETAYDRETEVYGNEIYKLIGGLPANEMIQGRMSGGAIFAIFAKPVSKDSNRILILSDSAGAGFTGVLIGYINDTNLEALRQAILMPRDGGGTSVYLRALNF